MNNDPYLPQPLVFPILTRTLTEGCTQLYPNIVVTLLFTFACPYVLGDHLYISLHLLHIKYIPTRELAGILCEQQMAMSERPRRPTSSVSGRLVNRTVGQLVRKYILYLYPYSLLSENTFPHLVINLTFLGH